MSIKSLIKQLAHRTDETLESLDSKLRSRLGLDHPMHIVPYRGFGNRSQAFISGRVLRNRPYREAQLDDNFLDNIIDTYRYVASLEVPDAQVQVSLYGVEKEVITDNEGYFRAYFNINEIPDMPLDQAWHPVRIHLANSDGTQYTQNGEILIPQKPKFGVISDIDDTVMQSRATNYLKAAQLLLLNNARTRLPFPGVSTLYQLLHNQGENPIFYVSSSPWNLYPLLTDFFALQELPKGPLSLMEYGFSQDQFLTKSHRDHKLEKIDQILHTYPDLSFVLIGDSGQKDAEIYVDIAQTFRDRILAIYIRDVTDTDRRKKVLDIGKAAEVQGVHFKIALDSKEMAQDAFDQNLINNPSFIRFEEEVGLPDYLED